MAGDQPATMGDFTVLRGNSFFGGKPGPTPPVHLLGSEPETARGLAPRHRRGPFLAMESTM